MKLLKAYELFEYDKNYEGSAKGTILQYEIIVKRLFIDKYLKNLKLYDIEDLNVYIVKGFVIDLRGQDRLSINTIQSYFRHVRIFLNWLYENDYVDVDYQRKTKNVKGYKVLKEIYSDDEIYCMYSCIKGSSYSAWRRRAIITILLGCGLRSGEVCSLTVSDLYLNQGYIHVNGHKGRSDRRVPISFPIRKILSTYLLKRSLPVNASDDNVLFYNKNLSELKTNSIRDVVEGVTKRKGIKRGNSHLFRHTFGTRMALETDNVFYVQQVLGHKDLSTTKIYYHDASQYKIAKVRFDKIDNILSRVNLR